MLKKIYFLFLFGILSLLNAQDLPEQALQNFSEKFPQEKFHILLNKKSFVAGENIYFKCFVIDGFKPSMISTSLFIELYDKNKKLVEKKLVPIFEGEAFGNLVLSADLKEDVYFLRVYTSWSSNFDDKFKGLKIIPIYNPQSSQRLILNKSTNWKVSAFPESGNLLNNITTKIALRMTSDGVLPEKWSGYLID